MTTFGDRLEYLSPAACPVCGNEDRVFLRNDNNELVCRKHFPRHLFEGRADGRSSRAAADPPLPPIVPKWEQWQADLQVDQMLEDQVWSPGRGTE